MSEHEIIIQNLFKKSLIRHRSTNGRHCATRSHEAAIIGAIIADTRQMRLSFRLSLRPAAWHSQMIALIGMP